MTETQKQFLELAKECEVLSANLVEKKAELETIMKTLGYETYLQDPETQTVYKLVKPKGQFYYFKDIDYVRTAQGEERAGSLSKKEAQEVGFELKK